ncbi:hypothetical protein QBC32DRAFT_386549 [Pseudoneurospora amorphoporcata]|uniref:Uncharacterized protein n=1 Tax=Pseudoneurospora amorphoporcata TaxID=241081 RepID=A0AAN6NLG0_9PEZI|nr:hypothetical protein QBC32DRAFT_386549 [Pseudoneurospora amorphoporcata]
MSTLASSANVVARVTVQNTGAIYHVEFAKPPKHGDCWTIGSAPTADIDIGHHIQGISGKHLGLGFGQNGLVVVKILSSRGTSLFYERNRNLPVLDVESTVHDCIGEDSSRAPVWAVPVGYRVRLGLGHDQNPLKLVIEAFDHGQHVTRAGFWAWNNSSIPLINFFGLEGLVDLLNL